MEFLATPNRIDILKRAFQNLPLAKEKRLTSNVRASAGRVCTISWAIAFMIICMAKIAAAQSTQAPSEQKTVRMEADPSAEFLESGFHHLYGLDFRTARQDFLDYQKAHPDDPMGKAAEAASYLYEEFNEKGILSSEFFLNDARFLGGVEGSAAENRNNEFITTNHLAREMAKTHLKAHPGDAHDLLILTMTDGMESNYDALIEKKQLAALNMMKQAEAEANTLLAIDPNAKDAYVALGMSNYVIGCLPGFKKAFLWFGGVHGDREKGIKLMSEAAEHGHYFQPFAKIMLALAYERERQSSRARELLAELTDQFPTNPHYSQELAIATQRAAENR